MDRPPNKSLILVAALTLLGSMLGGAITVGASYGKVSTRVDLLERAQPITREEWNEFRDDLAKRLDRIEDKVDKYGK